jgi:iron(II)-dependent oxidoreductase
VRLEPFAIARSPVTAGQFAAFVEDGGYLRPELWRGAAAEWRRCTDRAAPAYWRRGERGWEERVFDGWRPLDVDAAVTHVSAFEAEAWCRWAHRRLPTEAEWELAASEGSFAPSGAAWEWTASAFAPYPGFAPDRYADYSAPWFGTHRTLRGRSWATHARLVHARFRNFYEPHRHDPIAGFRTCAV